jgi:hypothetical protein
MDWKVEIIMKWWETDINASLETVNIHSFRKSDYNVHVHTHLRLTLFNPYFADLCLSSCSDFITFILCIFLLFDLDCFFISFNWSVDLNQKNHLIVDWIQIWVFLLKLLSSDNVFFSCRLVRCHSELKQWRSNLILQSRLKIKWKDEWLFCFETVNQPFPLYNVNRQAIVQHQVFQSHSLPLSS